MNRHLTELAEIIALDSGSHESPELGVCVNELTAWIAGEKHSDEPQCASPSVARFLQVLNDSMPHVQRQRLAPYAVKQIGTRGTPSQEEKRAFLCASWTLRVALPLAFEVMERPNIAKLLEQLPPIVSPESASWVVDVVYKQPVPTPNADAPLSDIQLAICAAHSIMGQARPMIVSSRFIDSILLAHFAANSAAQIAAFTSQKGFSIWDSALQLADSLIAVTGHKLDADAAAQAHSIANRIAVFV